MKLLIGLGMFLAGAVGALSGITGLFSPSYEVTGYFLSAEGVTWGNDVTIGGLPVGTVTAVKLAPEGETAGALITFTVKSEYAPLRKGTRATIRPKGLLGTAFLDLQQGLASNPAIASGGTIPLQDTASPVSLDQVNNVFDKNTRQEVHALTVQGGTALDGNGAELNKLLAQLPAITSDLASATGAVDEKQAQLDALQVEFDKVAFQIAKEDRAFRADFHNGARLLDQVAAHEPQLQQQLTYANASFAKLNAALGGHEQDLNRLMLEFPGLEDTLYTFQNNSATALAVVSPCMNDVIKTISEMQSAANYKPSKPSSDMNNSMRTETLLVTAAPETGSYDPNYLVSTYATQCGKYTP